MKTAIRLESLLTNDDQSPERQLAVFAYVQLGVIDSLASGLLSVSDAVRVFYNADNCLFVRKRLEDKMADKLMSHGVQLPDLFTVLPIEEAHRQFQHELAEMRTLCLKLLEERRLVA